MDSKPNIAIDGPAGAGKSTVARMVAEELGYLYIDTGAMYRAITLKAIREGLDLHDPVAVGEMAEAANVELVAGDDRNLKILLDSEDVTEEIRSPYISQNVSLTASIPAVRKHLVKLQQAMAKRGGVVMEGRDVGTVVLPDARIKIYLTASTEERARRRREELIGKGYHVNQEQMEMEICERDRIDTTRKTDPLVPAPDAEIIDSSFFTVDMVVKMIIDRVLAVR
ncbi:(d)CMP kinase [Pelotomaculum terephthalicicum JT]|uniref:(d)CMP kinase n=1 Tax=Pelotomaculum TaxID=191373 RepID=UPI0009CAB6E1|nr:MULTISPECIES: (d)CMP kinase [Pelotomaculum]MCG9967715.1 (d)CMP kinase [Pelotomaculum terephthalicicum JT]OPX83991.1 MAG: Cytidylate kinase [Pelotomaculum sp. PtaB.Bin117]OPY62930.1 MAG: Cytidylate kinase [Pelotomaculum sp. PtaU1.Bin065]